MFETIAWSEICNVLDCVFEKFWNVLEWAINVLEYPRTFQNSPKMDYNTCIEHLVHKPPTPQAPTSILQIRSGWIWPGRFSTPERG